jgi:hypothetical protein
LKTKAVREKVFTMATEVHQIIFIICTFAERNQTKKEREYNYDKTISKNIITNYRFNATKFH